MHHEGEINEWMYEIVAPNERASQQLTLSGRRKYAAVAMLYSS